ncbi:MAG: polysaccharide deacetylase family protein [Bacillota bacterium]|nr:polysaccharide deacetylase family protein [Bacillota bacterium]
MIINVFYMMCLLLINPVDNQEIMSLQELQSSLYVNDCPEIHIEEIIADTSSNELGYVPVMLYHRIKESDNMYDISPNDFRSNLQRLYENDYVLIDLKDYLDGIIDIPAGKHPIVFTFDDGDISNYRIIDDGDGNHVMDKESAIGIMYEFYLQNPDFGFEAAFFLNGNVPFAQREYTEEKIAFMNDNGLLLCNHTLLHNDLSSAKNKEEVVESIISNESYYLNKYQVELVKILAIPFGTYPEDVSIIDDLGYSALKVGWRPEVSIFSKKFDNLKINRVQNGDGNFQFDYWMDYLDAHPDEVFVSDGNINTVTIPLDLLDDIDLDSVGDRKLTTYEVN